MKVPYVINIIFLDIITKLLGKDRTCSIKAERRRGPKEHKDEHEHEDEDEHEGERENDTTLNRQGMAIAPV